MTFERTLFAGFRRGCGHFYRTKNVRKAWAGGSKTFDIWAAPSDETASVALKIEKIISFRMVAFSAVSFFRTVKLAALKQISAPNESNFAVHLWRIIHLHGTATCKLMMFFKKAYFFTTGATDPLKKMKIELGAGW